MKAHGLGLLSRREGAADYHQHFVSRGVHVADPEPRNLSNRCAMFNDTVRRLPGSKLCELLNTGPTPPVRQRPQALRVRWLWLLVLRLPFVIPR